MTGEVTITRDDLIIRLGRIGHCMAQVEDFNIHSINFYVRECVKEFGLIEEEVKTLLFYINGLDKNMRVYKPNGNNKSK